MKLPNYQDYELEFLEAMATRFGMKGKNRIIFVERFREKNADSLHKVIAERYRTELLEGTTGDAPERILRQQLSAIYQKLKAKGCVLPEKDTKDRWLTVIEWLRKDHYPEWLKEQQILLLTCDQLWQHLWETATPTDKMKPVLLESLPTLDMGEVETAETEILSFPLDSKIRFEVNLDRAGYLLLLEKGPSGKIWCLCPSSNFAPKPQHTRGRVTLPQAGLDKKYFTLNRSGQEEIVAVITKEAPTLDWLPKSNESLGERHLTGLLEYLNVAGDCQVLRMAYKVTAA